MLMRVRGVASEQSVWEARRQAASAVRFLVSLSSVSDANSLSMVARISGGR